MKSYDYWLHFIPVFFVLISFLVIYIRRVCESKIEKREHELRMQREGHNMNLQKYFKKSQDKFDKLEYLADLYKLIRENLEEINAQIAENDRRTSDENRDNMNKMLQDKHSLLRELRRGKGDTNLEDIRSGLLQMLSNLRFQDGRSLEEIYKEQMIQDRLKQEQNRLVAIDEQIQGSSENDEQSDDQSVHVVEKESEEDDDALEHPDPKEEELEEAEIISDPALYDDLLKAR